VIWEDVKAELLALARVVFGLAIAAVGGFFLYLEFHVPATHTTHIAIFAGGILLGLAIMWPTVVIGTAKQIIVLMPIDVKLNGLRKTDPQSPTDPPKGRHDAPFPHPVSTAAAVPSARSRAHARRCDDDEHRQGLHQGYAGSVRNVPGSLSRAVYLSYGIKAHKPHSYEIDHLISLELGGSNSQKNLWPEPYPGAYSKDSLENALHRAVCAPHVDRLRAALDLATTG
jgi:hypothetical protein